MNRKNKNKKNLNTNFAKISKTPKGEPVEIQIEKIFSIITRDRERSRLEKWKPGRRNFS